MTNINIAKIAQVSDGATVVVLSAVGALTANDNKVTDLLVQLHQCLPNKSIWHKIASRYIAIVRQHCIPIDIDTVLEQTWHDIVAVNNYHYTLSVGEYLSARIMAVYLNRQYLEARQLVQFDSSGTLLLDTTLNNIKSAVDASSQYVMGGFYGGVINSQDTMTFSRGGSDISGALVSTAIGADIYENWTDVCGLCRADPRLIDNVSTVRCLSYDDMQTLADCGVAVLNNHSIYPVRDACIPINIRSIYNRADSGTLVTNSWHSNQLLSVCDKLVGNIYVTTIVATYSPCYILDRVARCISQYDTQLIDINISGNCTIISSYNRVLQPLYMQLVD